ncbi:hypothetical protein [Chitinophaga sp. sic0106]|uniref:hypothetical protein n=1 Tax=Chitinophaga sp. sic0106 TaxID=2854785 RepID=UPI001C48BDBF|nr:hypothetical protein [Chitinophaga sp. sic0106]MBV7530607.1 hypothetical protein [Chitinophaga sp. sic0106]
MDTPFFNPKLHGRRFEDHSIPVELLEDFNLYEELLFKVAKWVYYEQHDKMKVPKGFGHGVSLKLVAVSEGSAIANIVLAATSFMVGDLDTFPIFETARNKIEEVIDRADKGEEFTDILPPEFLTYFNKIGRRLHDDESISFSNNTTRPARLSNRSRKTLVLSAPNADNVSVATSFRGKVSSFDKAEKSCTVISPQGEKVLIKFGNDYSDIFLNAFSNYESGQKVLVRGIGQFNKSDKLTSMEVDSVTFLDAMDVPSRLDEFMKYKVGWFNGEGEAFNEAGITWLSTMFDEYFQAGLLLPYTFPTPNGEIQFEWKKQDSPHDLTAYVNLQKKKTYVNYQNMKNDDDFLDLEIDLDQEKGWLQLMNLVSKYFKA